VHISEMFRLVRGTGHILDVLDVLHADRLALRIHDGAFSAMDLTGPAPELPVVLDVPGKVADFLRSADLEPAERAALDQGIAVRRGQGYTLRVPALPSIHRQLLDRCQPLDDTAPAQRKARREYENRVNALPAAGLR